MFDFALRKLVVLAIAAMGLSAMPGYADEAADAESDEMPAELEQRIDEIRDRLALSDEQKEAAAPILEAAFEKQRTIMEEYGIDPATRGERQRLGLRDARKMRGEMDEVREETLESLAEVLTPEQLEEYQKIQEEGRQEMRGRMRANR